MPNGDGKRTRVQMRRAATCQPNQSPLDIARAYASQVYFFLSRCNFRLIFNFVKPFHLLRSQPAWTSVEHSLRSRVLRLQSQRSFVLFKVSRKSHGGYEGILRFGYAIVVSIFSRSFAFVLFVSLY